MTKQKLIFLVILLGYLFAPEMISWLRDEPLLFLSAIKNLESGELARHGLYGSKNIPFGPIAIWFYQICLLFTSNLILIVQIKVILFVTIIYLSTKKICAELNLDQNLAFLPLLSPYIFHYSRILWDNCFLIPSSFLFVAILLSFWRKPQTDKLARLCLIASLMFQIHLTSALLLVPAFLLTLWKSRSWLRNNLVSVLFCLLILAILNFNYLYLLIESYQNTYISTNNKSYLITPFGFVNFTAFYFYNYFIPEIYNSNLFIIAKILSWLSLIILIANIFFINKKSAKLLVTFLLILIISIPISLLANLSNFPHYLNSLLPIYIIFILIIINHSRFKKVLMSLFCIPLIFSIITFQSFIWINSGTKSPYYGATLGNQLEIFNTYNPDFNSLQTNVKNYQHFPYAMGALSKLSAQEEVPKIKNLAIIYKYQDQRGGLVAIALQN